MAPDWLTFLTFQISKSHSKSTCTQTIDWVMPTQKHGIIHSPFGPLPHRQHWPFGPAEPSNSWAC